ncbi:MAG: ABC transporter permease subunit [Oscillospiraceae bacterium]
MCRKRRSLWPCLEKRIAAGYYHDRFRLGAILGGSVIAESVFNLPGLGSLIVLSIKAKDTPSVLASVLLLAVFFALIMLIVDLGLCIY